MTSLSSLHIRGVKLTQSHTKSLIQLFSSLDQLQSLEVTIDDHEEKGNLIKAMNHLSQLQHLNTAHGSYWDTAANDFDWLMTRLVAEIEAGRHA